MDCLGPLEIEPPSVKSEQSLQNLSTMDWCKYNHSVICWKQVLHYASPGLAKTIDYLEIFHHDVISLVLKYLEQAREWPEKHEVQAATQLYNLIDEELEWTSPFKPSEGAFVKEILKARVAVHCARYFDADEPKTVSEEGSSLYSWLKVHLPSCVPRHYPSTSTENGPLDSPLNWQSDEHYHSDMCLSGHSNNYVIWNNFSTTDLYCCRRFLDILPQGILEFFGISSETLAHWFHTAYFSDPSDNMQSFLVYSATRNFGPPHLECLWARVRPLIFQMAVAVSLHDIFGHISLVLQDLPLELADVLEDLDIDP